MKEIPPRDPKRTRIKFCGNTRVDDVLLAAELSVDLIGFVLVPESPRYCPPAAAEVMRQKLRDEGFFTPTVALFQNASAQFIHECLALYTPEYLQWHGGESPEECAGYGLHWFKAVPMGEPQDYAAFEERYARAQALLADSHTTRGGGGSGKAFSWHSLPPPAKRRLPLMLAGGLRPETVAEAIRRVRPWAVDVSSGIEAGAKGVKDADKMRAFVAAVREADEALSTTSDG